MAKGINPSFATRIALLLLLFFTTLILPQTQAIWLNIPSSGTKCVSEEIQTHVVVLADYYVVDNDVKDGHPLPTISAKVCFNSEPSFFPPRFSSFISFMSKLV